MRVSCHTMSVLVRYVQGFAQQQAIAHALPNLAAMEVTLMLQPGCAYATGFEFGFELVLDGPKATHSVEKPAD